MDTNIARAVLEAHRLPQWREHPVRSPALLSLVGIPELSRLGAATRQELAASSVADQQVLAALLLEPATQVVAAANPRTTVDLVDELCPDLLHLRPDADQSEVAAALEDHRRADVLAHGSLDAERVERLLASCSTSEARTLLHNSHLPNQAAALVLHRFDHFREDWLDRDDLAEWQVVRAWDWARAWSVEPELVLGHPSCPLDLAAGVAGDSTDPYQELALLHRRLPVDQILEVFQDVLASRPSVILGPATWAVLTSRPECGPELLARVPAQQLFAIEPRARPGGRLDAAGAFLSFMLCHARSVAQVEVLLAEGRSWRWDCQSLLEHTADRAGP